MLHGEELVCAVGSFAQRDYARFSHELLQRCEIRVVVVGLGTLERYGLAAEPRDRLGGRPSGKRSCGGGCCSSSGGDGIVCVAVGAAVGVGSGSAHEVSSSEGISSRSVTAIARFIVLPPASWLQLDLPQLLASVVLECTLSL